MNGYSPCRLSRTTNELISRHHILWLDTGVICVGCIEHEWVLTLQAEQDHQWTDQQTPHAVLESNVTSSMQPNIYITKRHLCMPAGQLWNFSSESQAKHCNLEKNTEPFKSEPASGNPYAIPPTPKLDSVYPEEVWNFFHNLKVNLRVRRMWLLVPYLSF